MPAQLRSLIGFRCPPVETLDPWQSTFINRREDAEAKADKSSLSTYCLKIRVLTL